MEELIIKAKDSISLESNGENAITPELGACEGFGEEHKSRKEWDIAKEISPEYCFTDQSDNHDDRRSCHFVLSETFLKLIKIIIYVLTFTGIISFGVISKISVAFMTLQIQSGDDQNKTLHPTFKLNNGNEELKIIWMWALFLSFSIPEVFTLIESFRICVFRKRVTPCLLHFLTIISFETLHVFGLSLLFFSILPNMKNHIQFIMICHWVCLVPSILGFLTRLKSNCKKGGQLVMDALVVVIQLGGPISLSVLESFRTQGGNYILLQIWLSPLALFLVSFGWWENYVVENSSNNIIRYLGEVKKEMRSLPLRSFVYAFVSIWKIIVFFGSMVFIVLLDSGNISHVTSEQLIPAFIECQDDSFSDKLPILKWIGADTSFWWLSPFYLFLVQSSAAFACSLLGNLACKIHIQKMGYALPVTLISLITMTIILGSGIYNGNITIQLIVSDFYFWICFVGLLSQIWITSHMWKSESKDKTLLIHPFYCSLLIDQSMSFIRKRADEIQIDKIRTFRITERRQNETVEEIKNLKDRYTNANDTLRIFICATKWHETADEMVTFLKSVFKVDKSQCTEQKIQKKIVDNYYEYETHIFFDDGFQRIKTDDGKEEVIVNGFVKQFIDNMEKAACNVYKNSTDKNWLKVVSKSSTPYGGCLIWSLPGKTKFMVHLKDTAKIRRGKRWSQVMYMFYILGYKFASMAVTQEQKETIASKTFILSVDGDTGFQPDALQKLIDTLKKDGQVGAICGRIHPKGSGWMAWYQVIEYAYSHWLSKSAEQVFGCVLCAPGCFSLVRGSVIMDHQITRNFSSQANDAYQHIQYDKGEDRWLCTLILKAGYKVEYCEASKAFTHCPENFKDFCKQRSRWIPSDIANTLDLIRSWRTTSNLTNNISLLYICYQVLLMIIILLAPGTVFLVLVIAITNYFSFDFWISTTINVIPILILVVTCFFAKNDKKLIVAEILSACYIVLTAAIMMGATLQLIDGFNLESLPFLLGIAVCSLIAFAACLHLGEMHCFFPGIILYFILIPTKNIIVCLYSVINLHYLSWGTREVLDKDAETRKETTINCSPIDEKMSTTSSSKVTIDTEASNNSILGQITLSSDNVDEESILGQYWMKDLITLNLVKIQNISKEEIKFWKDVIEEYLSPNEKGKENYTPRNTEALLREFRNTAATLVILANLIFVIASLMLQKNAHVLSFTTHYIHMETIPFILLSFNGLVLSIQFIGMLFHRFETICQILTKTDLVSLSKKDRDHRTGENL